MDPRIHYLNGLYGDRNTPWAGGRGCTWVLSWAVWRHFWDHLPISLWHCGVLRWVGAGLQGRAWSQGRPMGPSPPKSKLRSPKLVSTLRPQLVDTTDLGPSHSYVLVELPPSWGPGPQGLQHLQHRGQWLLSPLPWPPAPPAPAALSCPSSCLPDAGEQGSPGSRAPVPAVTSSLPSSPLGSPGPSSTPQCPPPSFQEDSDGSLQASTCIER